MFFVTQTEKGMVNYMKMRSIAALILAIIFLTGCSGAEKPPRNAYDDSSEIQFILPEENEEIAVISTDYGDIYMRLYPDEAPMATAIFKSLVNAGSYNGMPFGYIESDFIIQAGQASQGAVGGVQPFGTEISDELHHYTGAVGMSKLSSDKNASGGIFYIVQTPTNSVSNNEAHDMTTQGMREDVAQAYREIGGAPHLDNNYTVFGHIFDGMDVVDEIASVQCDESGTPETPVLINSIVITPYTLPVEEEPN